MAFKNPLELHHNFVKLAEDSGFSFNTHKPRHHTDWNKIRQIDVDNVIRDRNFVTIEQHVNEILDCALESEFDVRILDEGVVKMFRLAQLTIEYQQFCRHYLDRSVYVLRDELSSVMQQLESTRKELREKDEEVKKNKRKSKHNFRPPLMYGNDNIANLILKTLSNNGEMLPTTSLLDLSHQYNKCNFCDKVFLNQLYLRGHMTRRHAHLTDMPQKEKEVQSDQVKLNDQIMELRSKLSEMETSITNMNSTKTITVDAEIQSNVVAETEDNDKTPIKEPETVTNNANKLLEKKLDEWKKEEHDKYTKEIETLRSQIMNSINSLKDTHPNNNRNETILIQQLQQTVKEQGDQIVSLRQEMFSNNLREEKEKTERSNEIEAQLQIWVQKVKVQTQQHELLAQKMNEVVKEAQEARALAEAERYRAAQLEALLEQRTRKHDEKESQLSSDQLSRGPKQQTLRKNEILEKVQIEAIPNEINKAYRKPKLTNERKALDELHQKAQQLLNMKSSSSSESSSERISCSPRKPVKNVRNIKNYTDKKDITKENIRGKNGKLMGDTTKNKIYEKSNGKVFQGNDPVAPRSPAKVVRAKLAEEVNSRLAAAGVDPLNNVLHLVDYNKQRMQLQQQQRLKTKKNPDFDKARNSIIAFLDAKAGVETTRLVGTASEIITPTKMTKAFSLTSVLSNVKNKALSLVKQNEAKKREGKGFNADVAKRALALLKTPPGSAHSSPIKTRASYADEYHTVNNGEDRKRGVDSYPVHKQDKKPVGKSRENPVPTQECNEYSDSSESDHKYYDSASLTKSAKSIENLMKSPVRRPSTANGDYVKIDHQIATEVNGMNYKSKSVTNVTEITADNLRTRSELHSSSNEDVSKITKAIDLKVKKNTIEENAHTSPKQAKGVLKNAPSTSSLNKKKVLFDLDAIQMKSVSASPSQSTEKSDTNEKYELGLVNLDDDEWDISSIDDEPLKNKDQQIKLNFPSGTSPKIAELKQSIESQLAHRKDTPSTAPVGGVDILGGPITKVASIGGSNTTLGSSVFDDDPVPGHNLIKLKHAGKDDSELDLSEFSIDGLTGAKRDSF